MGSGGSVIKAAAYIENDHVIPFHNEEHAEEIKTTKRSFFHKTKKRNLQPEIISSGNPQLKADCEVIPVKQNDTLNSKGFDCRKIEVSKRQAQPESQMTSSQGRKTLNSPTSSEKHFFTSSDVQKTRKAKVEKPKPIKNGGLPPVLMGNATASENKQVSNIKIPVRNVRLAHVIILILRLINFFSFHYRLRHCRYKLKIIIQLCNLIPSALLIQHQLAQVSKS